MKLIISFIALAITSISLAAEMPKDYVNAGKRVRFNGKSYKLVWSDNPSKNYFKQEYLQSGSTLEDYEEMITVDVLLGNTTSKQACDIKVAELIKRRESDPFTKYRVLKKGQEYVLDFYLCGGKKILEWNIYRYIEVEKGSDKRLVLIAYTRREPIERHTEFFDHLKEFRNEKIEKLDKVVIRNMGK